MSQNKIYVGNMPFTVTETELETAFASYGDIDNINLIKDRNTGHSRGFAFITFVKQHSAETALEMNGREINGRKITVSMAKERGNRRFGRGLRR